ncbi:WD40-repeat-containing domain protein [Polychytrium aggregatum]|uniref:WD40-repeat-containing domain protein n=1 Tax=Polychytrium aggregatum TaxID=110093 RepID=UPI0022FF1961|nr:WD40-repeat-containing domain protein [Polychytrium aggregatum]KAI9206921.1 WD40-repeat-containing domain protein [Polychytrium aggregatum]
MMHDGSSCVYGLKHHARCLTGQPGEQEKNRFLVGTQGYRCDNEIHLLEFDEDEFEIRFHAFRHPNEIWHIAPSPARPDLLITCHREVQASGAVRGQATLLMMGALDTDEEGNLRNNTGTLETLLSLEPDRTLGDIHRVLWSPTGGTENIVAVGTDAFGLLSIDRGLSKAASRQSVKIPLHDPADEILAASWDPHNTNSICLGAGGTVHGWDIKANTQAFKIENAHDASIRDIAFNPNKAHSLATCGDDCFIRFWDLRKADVPVKQLNNHTHWIWSVAFNKFHDQLLLSSSSDSLVNLESIISISSSSSSSSSSGGVEASAEKLQQTPHIRVRHHGPLEEEDEDQESNGSEAEHADDNSDEDGLDEDLESNRPTDGLVATYDQHEESVYSVAWSEADPWVFASLSCDGRVVVNTVPREHKYKIIL